MPGLWKRPLGSIPSAQGQRRRISGGALINLDALRRSVQEGTLDEENVWAATDSCERDLENEQWSYEDVLHMLSSLTTSDYRKSEWCQIKGGHLYPCDVYVLPYDCDRGARNAQGFEVYIKFSVREDGQLMLVLVSCHASR